MKLWSILKGIEEDKYSEKDIFAIYENGFPTKRMMINEDGSLDVLVKNDEGKWKFEEKLSLNVKQNIDFYLIENELFSKMADKLAAAGVKIFPTKPGDGKYSAILNSKKVK